MVAEPVGFYMGGRMKELLKIASKSIDKATSLITDTDEDNNDKFIEKNDEFNDMDAEPVGFLMGGRLKEPLKIASKSIDKATSLITDADEDDNDKSKEKNDEFNDINAEPVGFYMRGLKKEPL